MSWLGNLWPHGVASTFPRPHLVHRRPTELNWPQGDRLLGVPPGVAPQVMEVGLPKENLLAGHCSPSHSDWSPQMETQRMLRISLPPVFAPGPEEIHSTSGHLRTPA